jgi:hypothetical protein
MLIADPVIWNKSGILSPSDVILSFFVEYDLYFVVILLRMLNFNYHDYHLLFICPLYVMLSFVRTIVEGTPYF